MPQMSPIYWLIMMMYFISMLLILIMLIYFFSYIMPLNKTIGIKINNSLNWMW